MCPIHTHPHIVPYINVTYLFITTGPTFNFIIHVCKVCYCMHVLIYVVLFIEIYIYIGFYITQLDINVLWIMIKCLGFIHV